MKGTEKIIAHIQADAKAQTDAILKEADEKCAAIRADYEKQAKEAYAERIRAGVKANQDRLDRMVAESFDLAVDKLVKLPEAEYIALLAKLAAKASVTGDEEIVLNAHDRKAVGAKVVEAANKALAGGKLTLSEKTGDFKGGLILRRGNIEANCTTELLVDLCRDEMAAELAGVLFG